MRAFILGNGPSLSRTPLHLLRGEHCWGVNQIHLIYPHTDWRPTHVLFAEMTAGTPAWFPKIWAAVRANPQAQKYARDDAWWYTPGVDDDKILKHFNVVGEDADELLAEFHGITRYNACTHHDIKPDCPGEETINAPRQWHFPQICKFGGSVPMAIQVAIRSGLCDEIFLLGCDLGHRRGTNNHFHPDYAINRGITEEQAVKRNMANAMGHQLAFANSPIPIYNATIGGHLEVYPRVNLEDIL